MNEDVHTSIEEGFKPYLHSMLAADLSFYAEPARVAGFFWGLAVQYLRTNQIKRARGDTRTMDLNHGLRASLDALTGRTSSSALLRHFNLPTAASGSLLGRIVVPRVSDCINGTKAEISVLPYFGG
jgi:hypothetical protein